MGMFPHRKKGSKICVALAMVIAFCGSQAGAQSTNDLRFEHISTNKGLSQVSVLSMLQDRLGFIWFATQDGLNKYDGYNFTTFRNDENDESSIGDNDVWTLVQGENDEIWIGLHYAGLNRYDPRTGTFERFRHHPDDPNSLSSDNIRFLWYDTDGTLWIGTNDAGLNHFNPKTKVVTRVGFHASQEDGLDRKRVLAILRDSRQNLWIGTCGGGLSRYVPDSRTFVHSVHREDDENSLSGNCVSALLEDSRGNLWVGTSGSGLNLFNPKTGKFKRFRHRPNQPHSLGHDYITIMLRDREDNLWIGTRGGISKHNPATQTFVNYEHQTSNPTSLSHNAVYSILEDNTGTLWFGTLGGGANKFDVFTKGIKTYRHQADNPNSPSHNVVRSLLVDADDHVWISTYKGVDKYDPQNGAFAHVDLKPDAKEKGKREYIFSMSQKPPSKKASIEGPADDLWLGVFKGGIRRYNPASGTIASFKAEPGNSQSLISNDIETILTDSKGNVWIGTLASGLSKLDPQTGAYHHFRHNPDDPSSISSDAIKAILEDHQGEIWIGTKFGLNKLVADSGIFERYRYNPSSPVRLSHDSINTIYQDSRENLWMGTDGGLAKIDSRTGKQSIYAKKHGFPNLLTTCIVEDDLRNLWVGTNDGLVRFDPESEKTTVFDSRDGLQGNSFMSHSCGRTGDGMLYFGGENGLSVIDPKMIRKNEYPPPIVFTDFRLFNKSVAVAKPGESSADFRLARHISYAKALTLDYTDYIFSIEFSALNYRQPEKNRYMYQLEGLDKQWIETTAANRRATYTDLPHGSYLLRVRASNDDGVWNERASTLKLTILPPPWRSWWAYALYLVSAIALIFWFIQYQRNKVRQKQRELDKEIQISQRLRQVDKLKDEFLANTSHELRTPLNGIIGIVESLIDRHKQQSADATESNLKLIFSSGKRLASLVDDILDFSKMKNQSLALDLAAVELRPLVDVVLATSRTLIGNKPLELVNEIDATLPLVLADENRLQQILFNLVGNAIKFTESGTVSVSAKDSGGEVEIGVSDTGIGIPDDKLERIFESFEQVDGGSTRAYGGTGLGLTVTRQLVELHGGKVSVESTVDKGSVFSFTLKTAGDAKPIEMGVTPSAHPISTILRTSSNVPSASDVAISPKEEPAPEGDFNILIVDDDPINLKVLENHLSLQNYTITQATNGNEALAILTSGVHIDLILLDIMMPRMSGYEVVEKLRGSFAAHELPVIFLTAKNQVADLVAGFAAGGNDYLPKPIAKAELLSRVKTHLELLDINRNLETKVRDRTAEVVEQKKQLELAYREVNQTKDALWGEMQLAKKIQVVLVPDCPQIPGYFIATHMETADSVGGDYYDVVQANGKNWLIIGDVSGHGVTAGLVMMMAQTALHHALHALPTATPDEILTSVNRVVFENIQKLGESKYMTLTLLSIDPDGTIFYTGLHQDIYIYRQSLGQIETAETKGIWLGVVDDIDKLNSVDQLKLQSEDALILYTDGIVEARDPHGRYTNNRLKSLVEKIGHEPVDSIRDQILRSLEHFTRDDDVTLVVVKKA